LPITSPPFFGRYFSVHSISVLAIPAAGLMSFVVVDDNDEAVPVVVVVVVSTFTGCVARSTTS